MTSQLDKPSQWATGGDSPTDKQKAFISTLAASKGAENINPNEMNKYEASITINDLKNKDTQNSGAAAGQPIQNPDTWQSGSVESGSLVGMIWSCGIQLIIPLITMPQSINDYHHVEGHRHLFSRWGQPHPPKPECAFGTKLRKGNKYVEK